MSHTTRPAPSSRLMCMPGVLHILGEEDLEGSRLWPPADLEALCKQDVKAKSEFSNVRLGVEAMPQHAHRVPWKRLRKLLAPCILRISIQLLANHKISRAETSINTHNNQHRFYRISSEKSLNKPGTIITANSSSSKPGIRAGVGGRWLKGIRFPELPQKCVHKCS